MRRRRRRRRRSSSRSRSPSHSTRMQRSPSSSSSYASYQAPPHPQQGGKGLPPSFFPDTHSAHSHSHPGPPPDLTQRYKLKAKYHKLQKNYHRGLEVRLPYSLSRRGGGTLLILYFLCRPGRTSQSSWQRRRQRCSNSRTRSSTFPVFPFLFLPQTHPALPTQPHPRPDSLVRLCASPTLPGRPLQRR